MALLTGVVLTMMGSFTFINGIEYLAYKFRWSQTFLGSVISPIITSTPELIVFTLALILYGYEDVSIGTILGEPLIVSTLIYSTILLLAIASYVFKRRLNYNLHVDRALKMPYIIFTVCFLIVLITTFIGNIVVRYFISACLLLTYIAYIHLMYRVESFLIEEVEKPYFSKILNPLIASTLQVITSICLMYLGSELMISNVKILAVKLNLSSIGVTIIVIPIATVLPEAITSILWSIKGRDTIALGCLIGEEVLYSTFYPALAFLVTDWSLDFSAMLSIIIVELISLAMLLQVLKGKVNSLTIMLCLGLYVLYLKALLR